MTTHRVWKYGDNVNTDLIFPGKYTYTAKPGELGQYALADLDPEFAANVQPGDVVVAGRNWGNGSSREQAVTALLEVGVAAVIAASFARIFFRNAVNNGLLVVTCPPLAAHVETGDIINLDIEQGQIECKQGTFSFPPLPASMREIIGAGGLIPYLRQTYANRTEN